MMTAAFIAVRLKDKPEK